ncbi:ABC transporter permease [Shewanella atlantica]|uniref:ABC transporter permease n=1 Tax=Shewanella atlantica TaxID=271099 RepID=A0A3S0IHH9_9GAMM|nr:FtsX-like permease family protein [Shewanella atlantica]RTR32690.1 ABC transporter permease [Shewanella atlantica]
MLIKLAWRNLWRNKLRTAIMLSAMAFGLIGVVTMIGFMNGMYGNMIDNAISWQTSHVQVHHQDFVDNPETTLAIVEPELITAELDKISEVIAWSERFIVDGMVASARSSRGVRVNGVDIDAEARVTPIASSVKEGSWLPAEGRHPVVVSLKTAQRLRLKLGSKVVITFSNAEKDVTGAAFRVSGFFSTPSSNFDDGNIYVRRTDLMAMAGIDGSHEIAVLLDDKNKMSNALAISVRDKIRLITSSENSVRDWQQIQPMLASIIAQMGPSNAILLGIFVLAMGFGVVNIMLMSVFERTREFGVLMAVGMQKHKVFALIIFETSLLGVTGATLGLMSSLGLIELLQITGIPLGNMAEGLGAFGVDTTLYPQVAASEYRYIFITVVLVCVLAALYPARQILKQRPVDAMAEKH